MRAFAASAITIARLAYALTNSFPCKCSYFARIARITFARIRFLARYTIFKNCSSIRAVMPWFWTRYFTRLAVSVRPKVFTVTTSRRPTLQFIMPPITVVIFSPITIYCDRCIIWSFLSGLITISITLAVRTIVSTRCFIACLCSLCTVHSTSYCNFHPVWLCFVRIITMVHTETRLTRWGWRWRWWRWIRRCRCRRIRRCRCRCRCRTSSFFRVVTFNTMIVSIFTYRRIKP